MTGEFRGYTVQTQYVTAQDGGYPIPVVMPADVEAGDYLFIVGGNANINYISFDHIGGKTLATGANEWEALAGAPYILVKVADGSEGGATVTLTSRDTDDSADQDDPDRVSVLLAMCYRFPRTPVYGLDVGEGPNGEFIVYDNGYIDGSPPVDSLDQIGSYPGLVTVPQEFRLTVFVGQGFPDASFVASEPLDSATWQGTDIVDQTGLHSLAGLPDPDSGRIVDSSSVTVADQTYLFGNSDPETGIILGYSGFDANGFLNTVGLVWPVEEVLAYWGILHSQLT